MPSSTHKLSVRSHVPVAVLLTSPLPDFTGYRGARPSMLSQICVRVTQPPRVVPSADSRYSRSEDGEYRMDTVTFESHFGLAIALLGETVSAASTSLAAAIRLMIDAVRSIVVVVMLNGKNFVAVRYNTAQKILLSFVQGDGMTSV